MGDQPIHESELVGVFVAGRRIAVGQIDAGEPHDAFFRRQHRLDIAGLFVGRIAGQAAHDFERPFGEYGHAVEALLAVRRDVIAEVFDFGARECVVLAFQLLQAQSVRARLLEIGEEMAEPLADGIDVPGGDAQGVLLCRARLMTPSLSLQHFRRDRRAPIHPQRRCAHIHCSGASRIIASNVACRLQVAAAMSALAIFGSRRLDLDDRGRKNGRRRSV